MNSSEQRQHTRKTDALEKSIEDLETVVNDQIGMLEALRGTVNDERGHRLKLADDQELELQKLRIAMTGLVKSHEAFRQILKGMLQDQSYRINALEEFQSLGFWGRLQWLFLGR
jgi:hypothetical protein